MRTIAVDAAAVGEADVVGAEAGIVYRLFSVHFQFHELHYVQF